ncbi:MAG: hypothetical protein AABW72_02445 [archaeon]
MRSLFLILFLLAILIAFTGCISNEESKEFYCSSGCHPKSATCTKQIEPVYCTMEFQLTDGCAKYFSCEKIGNDCKVAVDEKYEICMDCINNCVSNSKEPLIISECAQKCTLS